MEADKVVQYAERIYHEGDLSTLEDKLRIERIISQPETIDREDEFFIKEVYEENFGYGYG